MGGEVEVDGIDPQGRWSEEAVLAVPDEDAETRGGGAELVAGAGTVVAGGFDESSGEPVVLVFERSDDSWSLTQRISERSGHPQRRDYGHALALDDDTLLIGLDPGGGGGQTFEPAAVDAYVQTPAEWAFQARLEPPAGLIGCGDLTFADLFARGLAVSGDVAAVGLIDVLSQNNVGRGVVCTFVREAGGWEHAATIQGPQSAGICLAARFGQSISIQGGRMLVGGPQLSVGVPSVGSARLYSMDGGNPTLISVLEPPVLVRDQQFGRSVVLTPDGGTALVGAVLEDASGAENAVGASYAFDAE